MGVPVYKRILELFEAEGINTLFGIPDPNFVHMFLEAEKRGWTVVAPHHEAACRLHGRGRRASPASLPCASARWAGHGQHDARHPVRPGGKFAGHLPQRPACPGDRARVRRGRIQFVRQEPMIEDSVKYSASIEYADQVDEIIREAIRKARCRAAGPGAISNIPATSSSRSWTCRSAAAGALSPRQPGCGYRPDRRGRRS
jgi:acetolactate synthase-1/2/3 large subunit